MDIQNNDIAAATSYKYDILSLTNSTFLTADMILLRTIKPVRNSWV
jgi:hypothetical protein